MSDFIVIEDPVKVVLEQADDEALWFTGETIEENILQQALRRLHAAVEGEEFKGFKGQHAE